MSFLGIDVGGIITGSIVTAGAAFENITQLQIAQANAAAAQQQANAVAQTSANTTALTQTVIVAGLGLTAAIVLLRAFRKR